MLQRKGYGIVPEEVPSLEVRQIINVQANSSIEESISSGNISSPSGRSS